MRSVSWDYRRVHGELLVLGVKVAASTVWEILKEAGIDPAPGRACNTWADFLRSLTDALLACDYALVIVHQTMMARTPPASHPSCQEPDTNAQPSLCHPVILVVAGWGGTAEGGSDLAGSATALTLRSLSE